MKKILLMTLACLLFACSASANEWGLRGGVYDIVTSGDRYEGYTCNGADDGNQYTAGRHVNHAILENRYHAVLIAAWRNAGKWDVETVSTTAVYQPDDKRGEYPNYPTLSHIGGGFVLAYGDSERYTFWWEDGQYVLGGADYFVDPDPAFSNSLIDHAGGLLFWQSGPEDTFLPIGEALLVTDGITLSEFNIEQTPRSLMEVRRLNQTRAALMAAGDTLRLSDNVWEGEENGRMVAVYSAPDVDSYRSGGGKAAVSLKEDADILAVQDGWTLLQYEVSPRTSRIGWVEGELSEGAQVEFASVPLIAMADTFLTDDPLVSQYEQAEIPAGTELTGLSVLGEYYAYVEYEADKLYRGFVPLKDLQPKYDLAWEVDALSADVRWDVMDALCGKWYKLGDSWRDALILFTDGTWRQRQDGQYVETGNYRVYDGEDGDYDIILRTEANEEVCYTLRLNEDATICLDELYYTRDEYSTYGNG